MSPISRTRGWRDRVRLPKKRTWQSRHKKAGQRKCKGKIRFPTIEAADVHAAGLRSNLHEPAAKRIAIHGYQCRDCTALAGRPVYHVGHDKYFTPPEEEPT